MTSIKFEQISNSSVQHKKPTTEEETLRPSVEVPQDFITHYDAFNFGLFDGLLSECIGVYTRKGRSPGLLRARQVRAHKWREMR